jgi:hypothetical protein
LRHVFNSLHFTPSLFLSTHASLLFFPLQTEATQLKEGILSHIKSSTSVQIPNSSGGGHGPKILTQRTAFNKTAESRISQLDFDSALSALVLPPSSLRSVPLPLTHCLSLQSSEVNKLEKKLIYQRSEVDEYEVCEFLLMLPSSLTLLS